MWQAFKSSSLRCSLRLGGCLFPSCFRGVKTGISGCLSSPNPNGRAWNNVRFGVCMCLCFCARARFVCSIQICIQFVCSTSKKCPSGSFLPDSCCWVHGPWRSLSVMKKLESLELKFTGLFVNHDAMATPCLIALNFCMTSSWCMWKLPGEIRHQLPRASPFGWWPTLAQTISYSSIAEPKKNPHGKKVAKFASFAAIKQHCFNMVQLYFSWCLDFFCNFTTFYIFCISLRWSFWHVKHKASRMGLGAMSNTEKHWAHDYWKTVKCFFLFLARVLAKSI